MARSEGRHNNRHALPGSGSKRRRSGGNARTLLYPLTASRGEALRAPAAQPGCHNTRRANHFLDSPSPYYSSASAAPGQSQRPACAALPALLAFSPPPAPPRRLPFPASVPASPTSHFLPPLTGTDEQIELIRGPLMQGSRHVYAAGASNSSGGSGFALTRRGSSRSAARTRDPAARRARTQSAPQTHSEERLPLAVRRFPLAIRSRAQPRCLQRQGRSNGKEALPPPPPPPRDPSAASLVDRKCRASALLALPPSSLEPLFWGWKRKLHLLEAFQAFLRPVLVMKGA